MAGDAGQHGSVDEPAGEAAGEAGLRDRFDRLVRAATLELPPEAAAAIDHIAIIIEDRPSAKLMAELVAEGVVEDEDDEILGLHTGHMITEGDPSLDGHVNLPTQIHLFRVPIVDAAGGWEGADADERIAEEIRITLLHELGHHFGLDEDDLDRLGFA